MTTDGATTPASTQCTFVARQPIFDRDQKVYGYELLFRDGVKNFFANPDLESACRHTLDTSLLVGAEELCGGAHIFINCTREVLLEGYVTLLPPKLTVVEILENIAPDAEVSAACASIKQAGYRLALDDYVPDDPRESLIGIADFIKFDLIATPRDRWTEMVERYAGRGTLLLAEKVETHDDFHAVRDLGFDYFQGYFFQKPVVFSAQGVPACQLNYLRMLQVVHQPELDWKTLELLIKQEASLCYRLLRYLNSAMFAFANEIKSVRHALSMIGEREVRRWISLVATMGASRNQPDELVQSALVRARFCEVMAQRVRHTGSDSFLVGLLSLMNTILGISMPELLERVAVDREIKAALLGEMNRPRLFLELACAQESADWAKCTSLASKLRMSEGEVSQVYMDAMRWARDVVRV